MRGRGYVNSAVRLGRFHEAQPPRPRRLMSRQGEPTPAPRQDSLNWQLYQLGLPL